MALMLFAPVTVSQVNSVPPTPQNGTTPPTFYRDVLPILQEHCQSCHRAGEIAPMSLVTFDEAHRWSRAIAHMTATRQMPPWFAEPNIGHFSNDPSLTRKQIATLKAWAAAGAPAGDPRDAPPARHWGRGWNIAEPDVVVKMPEPVALPAAGDVDYTYEIVPTGFTEDRWVRMSEILIRRCGPTCIMRPGLYPATGFDVVEAARRWVFSLSRRKACSPTRKRVTMRCLATFSDILLVYAPGSAPDEWPEGEAKLIPHAAPGSGVSRCTTVTRGRAVLGSDQHRVGSVRQAATPKQRVLTLQLTNGALAIPPNWDNYFIADGSLGGTLPNDATLLEFFSPHAPARQGV